MAPVDFVSHARSLGADEKVADAQAFQSLLRGLNSRQTVMCVMDVDPYDGWTTEGHVVGEAPSVSKRRPVRDVMQRLNPDGSNSVGACSG